MLGLIDLKIRCLIFNQLFQLSFESYGDEQEHNEIRNKSKPSNLTRSLTDSNISYSGEEITEAPGSAGYVNKDGDIDILVVLQVITIRID